MLNIFRNLFFIAAFLTGLGLTVTNVYGLYQSMRPLLPADELRFINDVSLSYEETLNGVQKIDRESEKEYAARLTRVIAQGLAHINWNKYDNTRYNQLIPIWENYFLYFMGKFSGIPEFKRYHYSNYQKSLKRGIGICGDAAMIMSQLLDKQDIKNQILTFPGHVVVAAQFDGKEFMFDPDFGVALVNSPDKIHDSPWIVNKYYKQQKYSDREIRNLNAVYGNEYQRWNGVEHFIFKKYYFEKISYMLKWPLPFLMIIFSLMYFQKKLFRK